MSNVVQASEDPPIPYYARAIAMGLPAIMLGLQLSGWIFFIPGAIKGHADFRQLYVAGYTVRTGHSHELFDYALQKQLQDALVSPEQVALPFIRPAYQALLFVPFSLLSYRCAYFLFLTLNVFLFASSFRMLRPDMSKLTAVWHRFPEALFISFLPAGVALMQGQDSTLLLFLLAAAWRQLQRGSQFSAGVLVGLGMFKYQITIPIVVLLLCWRRLRLFVGFLLSSSVVAGISVWLTGARESRVYVSSLFRMASGMPGGPNELHYAEPMHLMMNLHGLIYVMLHGHVRPEGISLVTVLFSMGLFFWIFRIGFFHQIQKQFIVAIATAVLFSYYIHIHDLAVLEIPILMITNQTIFALWQSNTKQKLLPAVSLVLFAAPIMVASWAYLVSLPLLLFIGLLLTTNVTPLSSRNDISCLSPFLSPHASV